MMLNDTARTIPILVIGESLMDVVAARNGKTQKHPGGSPMNVAIGLGRLRDQVSLLTSLGADAGGDAIRTHLTASNVTLAAPIAHESPTSVSYARIRDDGAAEYAFDLTWDIPHVTIPARIVHTGSLATVLEPGRSVVRDLIEQYRSSAVITFDPNIRAPLIEDPRQHRDDVEELCRLSHVVKLSSEDAAHLYPGDGLDTVARRVLVLGPAIVAITLGADGSRIYSAEQRIVSPAADAAVADTVGAGDSYMAGMIHVIADALAHQESVTGLCGAHFPWTAAALGRMIEFASVCSGITVGRDGANPPWATDLAQTAT